MKSFEVYPKQVYVVGTSRKGLRCAHQTYMFQKEPGTMVKAQTWLLKNDELHSDEDAFLLESYDWC